MWVFSAYFDLDSERTHKEGATAIPWTSIAQYAVFHEVPDSIVNDFIYLIKRLDSANLERIDAEIKRKYESSKTSSKTKKR